jgi:hypothetical protein
VRLANTGPWPTPITGSDSPIGSELTYACSQGGTSTYIYGDDYLTSSAATTPMESAAKAMLNKGKTVPFDQVTGFNGYPTQWEDGCIPGGCHVRWGAPSGMTSLDAAFQRCDNYALTPPSSQGPGVRCCTD